MRKSKTKICICGSLAFTDEIKAIDQELRNLGFEVLLPNGVIKEITKKPGYDPVAAKRNNGYDAIRDHFKKIKQADAVLICNFTKRGIENYIGANTFLEAGFAYYLGRPTYALNPLPDQAYIHDEIMSLDIVVIDGDLSKIKLLPRAVTTVFPTSYVSARSRFPLPAWSTPTRILNQGVRRRRNRFL